ncbi:MAG: PEP-CTERM sorting domain-containing protein [Rubripirellula sp.]
MTVPAHGDLILGNTIDGSVSGNWSPYSTNQMVATGVSSLGVSTNGLAQYGGFDQLVVAGANNESFINFAKFFSFTITPDANATVDFDDFTYNSTIGPNGSDPGPTIFALRSSIGSFSSDIGTANGSGATTIDLTDAAFQGVTSPIEFRLFVQGAQSGDSTFRLENFAFNGTVNVAAVPEPSSIALVALGGAGAFLRIRRRKNVKTSPAA